MLTRRSLLLSIPLFGATTAAYAIDVEPNWFETVVQPVRIPGISRPVRLLHLSDLHASAAVPLQTIETAVGLALETKPDVICLTGDFVTQVEELDADRYATILAKLTAAAPIFATLGNHDGGVHNGNPDGYPDTTLVRSILRRAGIELLHNESTLLTVRGQRLRLVGVGDLWAKQIDPPSAFACSDDGCPTIALAHNPDTQRSSSRVSLGSHAFRTYTRRPGAHSTGR